MLLVSSGRFRLKGGVCRLPSQTWESRQMELFRGGFLGGCGRFMMKGRIVDVFGGLPSQLAGILDIAVL